MEVTNEKKILNSVLLLSLVSIANADNLYTVDTSGNKTTKNIPEWCQNEDLGFSFYCDWEVEKSKKSKTSKQSPAPKTNPYSAKVNKQLLDLKEARAKAILEPTIANITLYMKIQQQTLEQATNFAKGTQKSLILDPSLDYTLRRPQGQLAKEVWYDQRNADIEETLKTVSKDYGIFFFYKSDCQYSKKYAPIIRAYSNKYRLNTMAISVDGGSIPYWPDAVKNKGQRELWNIHPTVPATVLYNNKTKQVIPIGYGVLTHTEISKRILTLLEEEKANDW